MDKLGSIPALPECSEWLEVQVIWKSPDDAQAGGSRLVACTVRCPQGATLQDALQGLSNESVLKALDSGALQPAIFGEHRPLDAALATGDRVELLGELHADPKESRARRARVQRSRQGDLRWGRQGGRAAGGEASG